jgi:hypothetical protein
MHHVGWALALDGVEFEEPKVYWQLSTCETPTGRTSFHTPSGAALHLNTAWKAARRAAACHELISWTITPGRFTQFGHGVSPMRQVHDESVPALFDYLEEAMLAATASFSAIEAFCNVTLVERLSHPLAVKRRKETVHLTAEEIEEQVGTDEKLKRLLPDALGLPSPAGKAVWEPYKRLKLLRDSITHFKRRDLARPGAEPTALHALLAMDPFSHPEAASEMIRYFSGSDPARWLNNPAWTR